MAAPTSYKIGQAIPSLKFDQANVIQVAITDLPAPPLVKGDKGPKVTALQEVLVKLERAQKVHVTGTFDETTAKALAAFQHDWSLKSSDRYDRVTHDAMSHALNGEKPKTNVHDAPVAEGPKGWHVIKTAWPYMGWKESKLQSDKITSPCSTHESCANFVSHMLIRAGVVKFTYTLSVMTLDGLLEGEGWKKVDVSQGRSGDVWIVNDPWVPYLQSPEQHTELVYKNVGGVVTLLGSNNDEHLPGALKGEQVIGTDGFSANYSQSKLSPMWVRQMPK